MKVATILPQTYLKHVQYDTYHMCLANLIGEPGMERYTNFYREQAYRVDSYVIMDNGLIEGNPRPISELVAKARVLQADEFILPDVFKDKKATLDAIQDAYKEACAAEIRMMAVPQGSTLEEWLSCACEIIGNFREIEVIGVPKVLVDIAGRDGRLFAIKQLVEMSPMLKHKQIHLLGCWKTPLEVLTIDKASRSGIIPMVRGVDSAIAYVYTRAGIAIDSDDRPDQQPIDFKHGLLENGQLGHDARMQCLLRGNLSKWRAAGDSRTLTEKVLDELNN